MHRPIILAGLAGALSDRFRCGEAAVITEVVDERGQQHWKPTLPLLDENMASAPSARPCIATSVSTVVAAPAARHQLRAQTGADLVDQESAQFARIATDTGWKWAIVRGISDNSNSNLPRQAGEWIDKSGRVRPGLVISSIVRQPTLVGELFGLRCRARTALAAVAGLISGSFPSERP